MWCRGEAQPPRTPAVLLSSPPPLVPPACSPLKLTPALSFDAHRASCSLALASVSETRDSWWPAAPLASWPQYADDFWRPRRWPTNTRARPPIISPAYGCERGRVWVSKDTCMRACMYPPPHAQSQVFRVCVCAVFELCISVASLSGPRTGANGTSSWMGEQGVWKVSQSTNWCQWHQFVDGRAARGRCLRSSKGVHKMRARSVS